MEEVAQTRKGYDRERIRTRGRTSTKYITRVAALVVNALFASRIAEGGELTVILDTFAVTFVCVRHTEGGRQNDTAHL